MKKSFDLLVTDKEPFLYLEKSAIVVEDEQLIALSKEGKEQIPANKFQMLILGYGTSITHPASIYAAKHNLNICFAKGGFNIHAVWNSSRYQNPISLRNQFKKHIDDKRRLDIAKEFIIKKCERSKGNSEIINKMKNAISIEQLIGYEAVWAKEIYKSYCKENFRRLPKGTDEVNLKISLLNNLLYNFVTSIIISCNLNPSIGFVHGRTRRGGLAFDIADIYKQKLSLDLAFNSEGVSNRALMWECSSLLRENNKLIIKEIINICKFISGKKQDIEWLF